LCWLFNDPAEFRSRAREFLAEGLSLGQRVCYVADDDVAGLAEDLRGTGVAAEASRSDAVGFATVSDMYPTGTVVDPAEQVRIYRAATEDALAAGFTGLRVAVNATHLVREPRQLEAFARYEHLVDDFMATRPFAAMCAYDRRDLSERATAQVACMHPNITRNATAFRLHAPTRSNCGATLAGELDLLTDELFPLALSRADPRPTDDELVFDAQGLTFVDHRNMLRLAEYADQRQLSVVLRTSRPGPARLVDLLNVDNVRVEALT